MGKKVLVYLLSGIVLVGLSMWPHAAHSQELRTVRTAIIAPSMSFVPLYVASDQGFFKEGKISSEIVVIRSSASQIQALVAGSVDFSFQSPAPLMRAVEKGADLVLLAGIVNVPFYDLIGGKNYKSIEELRGTTLAISGIADAVTVLLQDMLSAHGLTYPRDYTLLQAGGSTDRWATIQKGAVSAGLLEPPLSFMAKDQGFSTLGQLRDYVPEMQFTSVSANRSWAHKNATLVDDYLTSLLKAIRYIYENKSGTVTIIQKDFKYKPEYAERVYDYYVRNKVIPPDGAMTLKGVGAVLSVLEKMGDFKEKVRPGVEKYLDSSFLTRAQARLSR